jgi:hypothetical protein
MMVSIPAEALDASAVFYMGGIIDHSSNMPEPVALNST